MEYTLSVSKSKDAIKQLMSASFWFTTCHWVLALCKLLIAATYIENFRWKNNDSKNHLFPEDIQEIEQFAYTIIIASFIISLLIVWALWGFVILLYFCYFRSRSNYEVFYEISLNQNCNLTVTSPQGFSDNSKNSN